MQVCEAISFIPPISLIIETWELSSMQLDPPFWGKGLSHTLILERLPSPQVTGQEPQSLQVPQPPSTYVQMYEYSHKIYIE